MSQTEIEDLLDVLEKNKHLFSKELKDQLESALVEFSDLRREAQQLTEENDDLESSVESLEVDIERLKNENGKLSAELALVPIISALSASYFNFAKEVIEMHENGSIDLNDQRFWYIFYNDRWENTFNRPW